MDWLWNFSRVSPFLFSLPPLRVKVLDLRLIIDELATKRRFDHVEVCVKRDDAAALHAYEKAGFVDIGCR